MRPTVACSRPQTAAARCANAKPHRSRDLRVALIGYGEVGGIFGAALAAGRVGSVAAYDILMADSAWAAAARVRAARDRVTLATDARTAVANADLVISAVTAAATAAAAEAIASATRPGTFVLDVNSASPRTKTAAPNVWHAPAAATSKPR